MKALKILGVILGIALGILLILVFVAPGEMRVEKSIRIKAPTDVVFPEISSFSKMDKWSPWAKLDPDMKKEIEGEDGSVGAIYKWSGNEKVGVGQQEFIEIKANEQVKTKINFFEPWESEADAFIELASQGEETEVRWGFVSELPKPMNAMALFMDFTGEVEKDYEKGLASLKTLCEEKATKTFRGLVVQEVNMPTRNFIALRHTLPYAGLQPFLADNLGRVWEEAEKQKLSIDGRPSSLYFNWNEARAEIDMAAAVPVATLPKNAQKNLPELETYSLPAGKAILINYYGSYNGLGEAHLAAEAYLKANGKSSVIPCWEEYVSDPGEEPDSAKWLTRVYYFLENE